MGHEAVLKNSNASPIKGMLHRKMYLNIFHPILLSFPVVDMLQIWAEWVVQGDTHYNPKAAAYIESPLFHTDIDGGWFAKSLNTAKTKADVDPAQALLVLY
jgi:hypothetical protein